MTKEIIKILQLNSTLTYNTKKETKRNTIAKISKQIYTNIHTNTQQRKKLLTNRNKIFINNLTYKNIILRQTTCKRINAADINSLYPFSFINKLPTEKKKEQTLMYYITKLTKPNFERIPLYKIQINKYTPIYTITHLNYLKKLKYNIDIINTIETNYNNNIMTDFILHVYKKKQKNHKKITKLLLNSLYGKMLLNEYTNRLNNQTDLIIQTMITYSKLLVHKKANISHNPPCYSDTDSFYTRHKSITNQKENIGKLKNQLLNTIEIDTPRNYRYKTNNNKSTNIKGLNITKGSKKLFLPKNFVQIYKFFIIQTFIY